MNFIIFKITISWAHSSGQMSLLLYDLWGKVIRSWEVSGLESHTADLSELPAGLYLVRLKESKEKLSSTRLQIIR